MYGYKLDLEITNSSHKTFQLPIRLEWKGRVGAPDNDMSFPIYSTQKDITILADGRADMKEVILGEREPAAVFVYPAAVIPVEDSE